jgi:membrane fusion protein, macrolide-specific efflux system
MNRRKIVRLVLFVAVIGGVIAYLVSKVWLKEKPIEYLSAPAIRADIERSVLALGTLSAAQQVDVGAQVSGQLKAMRVKLGDRVTKGQLLAEIDPVLSKAKLDSTLANLESLEASRRSSLASLKSSREAVERQQAMFLAEATPKLELDNAKTQLELQEASLASNSAQIKQARSQVDSDRASLAYTQITAPIDGEIISVVAQEGQTVVASQTVPVIFKLANIGTMLVKAQISEADVIRIRPGQKAYFTILGDGDKKYFGTLKAIEPAPADFGRGCVRGSQ